MKQEVAEAILKWEDHDEADSFEEVTEETMDDTSRWSIFYSQVYKNTVDNTFWKISWSRGATEYQDEGPENIEIRQVRPITKTVTVYE